MLKNLLAAIDYFTDLLQRLLNFLADGYRAQPVVSPDKIVEIVERL